VILAASYKCRYLLTYFQGYQV